MVITGEKLTINQIKKRVGDSWVLIYNPVYSSNNQLLSGELIFFDKDKQKVFEVLKKDKRKQKNFATLFMGKVPVSEIYIL